MMVQGLNSPRTILLAVFAICFPKYLAGYTYDYHNVLLDHFASKTFQVSLACKALLSDGKRSGHIVFNLFCERHSFQVKITAPDVTSTCSSIASEEKFHLYLNVKSVHLEDKETISLIDPMSHTKKVLTAKTAPKTIDFGLVSYAQMLSTSSVILVEYKTGGSGQTCQGREGDSTFLELEYVLLSPAVPQNIEAYKFTRCSALNGYIPAGMLCDQYTTGRPLGCPANYSKRSSEPDPATGQDRRDLDCYQLVLGPGAEDVRRVMDGSMVAFESTPASSAGNHHAQNFAFLLLVLVFIFLKL